jgi:hypothetical protein
MAQHYLMAATVMRAKVIADCREALARSRWPDTNYDIWIIFRDLEKTISHFKGENLS